MPAVLDHAELALLVGGQRFAKEGIDLRDWMAHTDYLGEFRGSEKGGAHQHRVVAWWWAAVARLTAGEKRRLLQFVTGSPQPPALGFALLTSNDGTPRRFTLDSVALPDPIATTTTTTSSSSNTSSSVNTYSSGGSGSGSGANGNASRGSSGLQRFLERRRRERQRQQGWGWSLG